MKVFCYHGNESTILLFYSIFRKLLKFLVNFTLLKYVNSQRSYGFLITKELIFGFQILDLKDHFSASLITYQTGVLFGSPSTVFLLTQKNRSICFTKYSLHVLQVAAFLPCRRIQFFSCCLKQSFSLRKLQYCFSPFSKNSFSRLAIYRSACFAKCSFNCFADYNFVGVVKYSSSRFAKYSIACLANYSFLVSQNTVLLVSHNAVLHG